MKQDTTAAEEGPERSARRLLHLLGFVLAVVAGLALLQGTASADGQDDEMISYINGARAQQGKPALQTDPVLAVVAQNWANTMGSQNQLYHNPSLSSDVDRGVTTQWTRLGENVGVGYTIIQLHNAFMASAGHYANIMGDFNRVGVGHTVAGGRLWITVNFLKGPAIAAPPAALPSFPPFATAAALVNQQYVDFLARPADPTGTMFWASQLNANSATPPSVIQNFVDSPEFGSTVAPVARLYMAYFNRVPDYDGLMFWVGRVRAGTSFAAVSQQFAQSAEFVATYGTLSNTSFVNLVYTNVLGRGADAGGLAYWVDQLNRGATRGIVMVSFSNSTEYANKKSAEVRVLMVYVGMLRRVPDSSGYNYWIGQVRGGASLQSLIGSFFGSSEYRSRF